MILRSDSNHTENHHRCNHDTRTGLSDLSPKDKPWDAHRANVDSIGGIYARSVEFEKLASRMDECSGWLGFKWQDDKETGESTLKLKKAFFCRVRYCPVCQWRRSLMWQARFYQALPKIAEEYPKARWLFLTLTVRNCEITELSDTLQTMNKAWNKLIKRVDLKAIKGWIRTTEVTRSEDGTAHPHFHVLIMVNQSWFTGKYYVKHSRWVELWQQSLQANYKPNVDIRVVKAKKGSKEVLTQADMLKGAIAETLKYSTKADTLKDDEKWFIELTKQTHKKRFLATGGALKNILKQDQESNQDLINTGDEEDTPDDDSDDELLRFGWQKEKKQYHRTS